MDLKAFFEAHPRVAIAFSGGVDSTYLVTAAAQYAQSVHAYTIDSAFVPQCLFDRISKYDSAVFDRMMAVDLKISITFDMQIEETVLGKSLQHMIKKSNACLNMGNTATIQI